MGFIDSIVNGLANFFLSLGLFGGNKAKQNPPANAQQPSGAGTYTSPEASAPGSTLLISPAPKPANTVDVTKASTAGTAVVAGAWGSTPGTTSNVVSDMSSQMSKDGVVTSVSPQVITKQTVDLHDIPQVAAYYGIDPSKINLVGADGSNIYIQLNDGTSRYYPNPNAAPATVTYVTTSGQTVTSAPASASNPQTNVAQPVNVNNPPPRVAWATDANRIALGGATYNLDSYYYNGGITNQYGTYYPGYGVGTTPLASLPRGTTIGGQLVNCPANADLLPKAPVPAPAPAAQPVPAPAPAPAPAATQPSGTTPVPPGTPDSTIVYVNWNNAVSLTSGGAGWGTMSYGKAKVLPGWHSV